MNHGIHKFVAGRPSPTLPSHSSITRINQRNGRSEDVSLWSASPSLRNDVSNIKTLFIRRSSRRWRHQVLSRNRLPNRLRRLLRQIEQDYWKVFFDVGRRSGCSGVSPLTTITKYSYRNSPGKMMPTLKHSNCRGELSGSKAGNYPWSYGKSGKQWQIHENVYRTSIKLLTVGEYASRLYILKNLSFKSYKIVHT